MARPQTAADHDARDKRLGRSARATKSTIARGGRQIHSAFLLEETLDEQ